ncbi:MAG: F0F1 ATP synthase subunit epsilon [Deltaproteobacteria bacterium]|nr:F0F1 ATP synthase subunit epsilon [Deltaproteobacteria bacterium]
MRKINLLVVTPERTVVNAPVDMVGAVGSEGAFAVLPGHIDFLTDLSSDNLWYRVEGQTREMAVSGGFIEVRPDRVRVLADSAEYAEEIDLERAQLAFKRNQELLAQAKAAGQCGEEEKAQINQLHASLNRAAVRLKLARKGNIRR